MVGSSFKHGRGECKLFALAYSVHDECKFVGEFWRGRALLVDAESAFHFWELHSLTHDLVLNSVGKMRLYRLAEGAALIGPS